jgi:drug/metabolite transporter (DMT)-like permease
VLARPALGLRSSLGVGAIALALVASLSWGCADFVGGMKSRVLPVLTVITLSQGAGLIVIAAIVVARGQGSPGGHYWIYAALSAVGGLCGLFAFYRGLSMGAMSVVAPVSSLSAAVPVVFGLATGERPSALQGAGMILAVAGVVLAAREEGPEGAEGAGGPRVAAGVGLALIAAVGFGSFFVGMDKAAEADAVWPILVNRITGVSMLVLLVAAVRPKLTLARGDFSVLFAVGVLDMGANALFALATRQGFVSLVSVLASLYPVVVIALAHIVLRERTSPLQLAGAGLALGGVAMIVAG